MKSLFIEIKSSFVAGSGYSIEALPGITAIVILLITRYVVTTRRMSRVAGKRILKSQSLRSLLIQTTYVATWWQRLLQLHLLFPICG